MLYTPEIGWMIMSTDVNIQFSINHNSYLKIKASNDVLTLLSMYGIIISVMVAFNGAGCPYLNLLHPWLMVCMHA